MDVLKVVMLLIAGGLLLAILTFGLWFAIQIRPRRRRESGFDYVYVEDDGNARELDVDEKEYLSTEFHPADGARPYIKFRYESLTPDGWLRGYLHRRQLPKDISIHPSCTRKTQNSN